MITSIYERVRDSLFLIPAGLIVGLGAMAWVAQWIDGSLPDGFPLLPPTTVDSSRSILSTVATATITVAAIVFSMTAVVVQLATSQFSPRVTQGFLRDRFQQGTIGLTVGTFVYALIVLAAVRGSEEVPFTSHDFSVSFAVLLAVASMVTIVLFIDRIMRSMRIDTIIRRLAEETEAAIAALPEWERQPNEAMGGRSPETGSHVPVGKTGWVRRIHLDTILDALPADAVVRLDLRIGDYITRGEVAAVVWPELADETKKVIASAVTCESTRAIATDPSYGFRQLVDIALRALSPSINDATTGSDVIRHLSGPLQAVLLRQLPGRVVGGENGARVFLPRALTHSDYVHAAFREIRLNSCDQPYVLHALLETLASLIAIVAAAGHEGRTAALRQEAAATLDVVRESDFSAQDRQQLLDFARRLGLKEAEEEPAQ